MKTCKKCELPKSPELFYQTETGVSTFCRDCVQTDTLKICTRCRTEKPATLEYFQREERNKDGFYSWCRKCSNEYSNLRYHRNNPHAPYLSKRTGTVKEKLCPLCRIVKTSDSYYKNKANTGGLHSYCIACTILRNKKSEYKPEASPMTEADALFYQNTKAIIKTGIPLTKEERERFFLLIAGRVGK